MASTIEGYLAELRQALAGADPALVQDAVYDADEYLRSAAADGGDTPEAILAAIDDYGTPAEVAAAYREQELTVAHALRTPKPARGGSWIGRFFGIVADPGAWGAMFYMLLAFATGILYFTIVSLGVSLTLGFAVLIVGIPFALLFLAVVRAVSFAEGRIVEGMLGVRMPRRPRLVAVPEGAGFWAGVWARLKSWLTDYRTWTTMLYMVVQLFLGIFYFTVLVTALSICAAFIAMPIVQTLAGSEPIFQFDGWGYYVTWWGSILFVLAGILGLLLTLWLAKGIGYLHGQYAKFMLVGRFEPGDAVAAAGGSTAPVSSAGAGAAGAGSSEVS